MPTPQATINPANVEQRQASIGSTPVMELNRNQYFFMGLVVLLIGIQLRMVSSYTLTHEATKFLAERTQKSTADSTLFALSTDMGKGPQKVINPPEWLGWCLMSIGGVLILHSLAMKKPGG
jgi:hypothetical protein